MATIQNQNSKQNIKMLGRLRRTGISIPQLSRCLKSWSGWAAWDCGTSWVSARRNNGGRYNLSLKAMFDHARSILKDALFWCCQTCCWLWNFWRFRLLASSVSVLRWKSLLNLLDSEAQNRRLAFEIIHFLIFDLVFPLCLGKKTRLSSGGPHKDCGSHREKNTGLQPKTIIDTGLLW